MNQVKFLLDANTLIAAHQQYYAFDIVPSFWERISDSSKTGEWAIIDRVAGEVIPSNDWLSKWLKSEYHGKTLSSQDDKVIHEYRKIVTALFVQGFYTKAAIEIFLGCADSWLIAHGKALNAVVVTQEKHQHSPSRVKIPTICKEHNIECVNTYDFLRRMHVRI